MEDVTQVRKFKNPFFITKFVSKILIFLQ